MNTNEAIAEAMRAIQMEKVASEIRAALSAVNTSLDAWKDSEGNGSALMRATFNGKRAALLSLAKSLGVDVK